MKTRNDFKSVSGASFRLMFEKMKKQFGAKEEDCADPTLESTLMVARVLLDVPLDVAGKASVGTTRDGGMGLYWKEGNARILLEYEGDGIAALHIEDVRGLGDSETVFSGTMSATDAACEVTAYFKDAGKRVG